MHVHMCARVHVCVSVPGVPAGRVSCAGASVRALVSCFSPLSLLLKTHNHLIAHHFKAEGLGAQRTPEGGGKAAPTRGVSRGPGQEARVDSWAELRRQDCAVTWDLTWVRGGLPGDREPGDQLAMPWTEACPGGLQQRLHQPRRDKQGPKEEVSHLRGRGDLHGLAE